jgi:adenylosuccinate synthase
MSIDVILGLQWGDEGKGKIVDLLSSKYQIVSRFQGGPNAGHTIIFGDTKIVLHTVPSGITSEKTTNIIGNGVIIDPYVFKKEIQQLEKLGFKPKNNLLISKKSHLILPSHRLLDYFYEKELGIKKIGSTLKGIGPAYTDKTARKGIRIGDIQKYGFNTMCSSLEEKHLKIIRSLGYQIDDALIENMPYSQYKQLWHQSIENITDFTFIDSEILLNQAIQDGISILAEGAQGTLLDLEFGSYPFVTSSNTTIGGVCTGLGVPPSAIKNVFGVFKAYCTRVGSGPFPSEIFDSTGEILQKAGKEFGSTTGRARRCGWLDLPALRYSIMINGVTQLIMMKSDVLQQLDSMLICDSYTMNNDVKTVSTIDIEDQINCNYSKFPSWKEDITKINIYNDLPATLKNYVEYIEEQVSIPIKIISTGPDRIQTIFK